MNRTEAFSPSAGRRQPLARPGLLGGSALLIAASIAPAPLAAQAPTAQAEEQDQTIVVTGSRIRRDNYDVASPLAVISEELITSSAPTTFGDVVKNLPFNAGSQFQDDLANAVNALGTAQFNLRNLGLNSTLTMVNGRRVPNSAVASNDGAVFVDVNQFPLSMIGRIEVLKDGASAVYGSDAVAGVVNIITRQVEGLEVSGGWQTTTQGPDRSVEKTISAALGHQGERASFNLFFTWFHRSPILTSRVKNPFVIPIGNPGTFILQGDPDGDGPLFAGLPVPDPNCAAGGGTVRPLPIPGAGFCDVDLFKRDFYFLNESQRRLFFATFRYELDDQTTFLAEASNGTIKTRFLNLPDPCQFCAVVPASNPFNPFGVPVSIGNSPSVGGLPELRLAQNEYTRYLLGFERSIAADIRLDGHYMWGRSTQYRDGGGLVAGALQTAVSSGVVIQGQTQIWNPFWGGQNSPELQSTFIREDAADRRSAVWQVGEAVLSGNVAQLPAGPVGFAVGGQYRHVAYRADGVAEDAVAVVTSVINQLRDGVAFENLAPPVVQGQSNFSASQDVWAAFSEVLVPVTQGLEVSGAVRHESYSNSGATTNPRFTVRFAPTEALAFRSSYGTSFRAPSVLQLETGSQTINTNIPNPFSGPNCTGSTPLNINTIQAGNPDLKPEKARSINAGFTVRPARGLSLSADAWGFRYRDVIVRRNASEILLRDCLADGILGSDPLVTLAPGTDPQNPGPTQVAVQTLFDNAARVETNGLDVQLTYGAPLGPGDFQLLSALTYINRFRVQERAGGASVEGAGQRNKALPFASLPRLRMSTTALFGLESGHSLAASARLIGAYRDEVNQRQIPAWTTFDVQYSYSLENISRFLKNGKLALGVNNLFDRQPPRIQDEIFGFDSTVHDSRGRMVYANIGIGF